MFDIIVADFYTHVPTLAPSRVRGNCPHARRMAGVFDSEADEMQDTHDTAPQTEDAPDRLSDDPQTPAPEVGPGPCPF